MDTRASKHLGTAHIIKFFTSLLPAVLLCTGIRGYRYSRLTSRLTRVSHTSRFLPSPPLPSSLLFPRSRHRGRSFSGRRRDSKLESAAAALTAAERGNQRPRSAAVAGCGVCAFSREVKGRKRKKIFFFLKRKKEGQKQRETFQARRVVSRTSRGHVPGTKRVVIISSSEEEDEEIGDLVDLIKAEEFDGAGAGGSASSSSSKSAR